MSACMSAGQAKKDIPFGLVNFSCRIGSFRFYNATGTVHLHFKGTVLIRDLKGPAPVLAGNVKQEYPAPGKDGHGRVAYFGDGDITVNGHWDSMLWFGRDLTGSWNGNGGARLYGEYDKNMETGWYWFGSDVGDRRPWRIGGPAEFMLPPYGPGQGKPTIKGG